MTERTRTRLAALLTALVLGQVLWGLCVVGRHTLLDSELRLAWDRGVPEPVKRRLLFGEERELAEALSRELPERASVLLLAPEPPWIVSYYLLPRRTYWYRGFAGEADAARLPRDLLRAKGIGFVLFRRRDGFTVLRTGLPEGAP